MPKHGLYSTYVNYACRCRACTEANRVYQADSRMRRRGTEPYRHDQSAYQNYGCRCEICTAAHRDSQRTYRTRQGMAS